MSERMQHKSRTNGGPMVALRVMAGGIGLILLANAFGTGAAVLTGLAIVIVIVALAIQKN